ncbi:MAG: AraC family transcriptional regulator [Planctomycetes bacterium]|jgi:AraC-like DNA-binding protein|nr:AraC family transcriptional regulator [Planctomycetota bacterium]
MDGIINVMDDFCIHVGALHRGFPGPPQLWSVGHIARKTAWVRKAFQSFNYSFVLRGRGEYRTAEGTFAVVAPCVMTQWPGVHVEYGPHDAWEELYMIYRPEALPDLLRMKLADVRKPLWFVSDATRLKRVLAELTERLADVSAPGQCDAIDRLAESAVLESIISTAPAPACAPDAAISSIRSQAQAHYMDALDFDALAADEGMSPATFRRHWNRIVGMPPGRYQTALRIQQACRLLAETRLSIGEIAERTGFDDPLYFSRKFRQCTGRSATEYRRISPAMNPDDAG